MSKNTENLKLYELSPSQTVIMYQQKFCMAKNVVQVPFYFLTEKKVNLEMMKRAMAEEIRRNDSFRIRFIKVKGTLYEYFTENPELNMKVYSFASQKEQDEVLQKDASSPLLYMKDDTYRIVLFTRWDGKFGVYINVHHTVMDAVAVHVFFNDLCKVYDAMETGTEMPKPLDKFEESLKRDIECAHDTEKREKDKEFWRKTYTEHVTPPYYAGIEGPHRLDKARKKNPDMYTTNIFNPLIGLLTGGIDLNDALKVKIAENVVDGEIVPVTVNFGAFLSALINFVIMAFVVFLFVKVINKLREGEAALKNRKKESEAAPAAPTTKKCPYCQSEIDINATRCPHCTSELPKE